MINRNGALKIIKKWDKDDGSQVITTKDLHIVAKALREIIEACEINYIERSRLTSITISQGAELASAYGKLEQAEIKLAQIYNRLDHALLNCSCDDYDCNVCDEIYNSYHSTTNISRY